MFSIDKKEEDGFKKLVLRDESSGTSAVIIPDCGAILQSFTIIKNKEEVNVIDSYKNKEDFNNRLLKTFSGSKLSPFVCRLSKGEYHFGDKDYKFESFYLANHAIHGMLADKEFSLIGETSDEYHASVTMKYEYRNEDKGFPFNYDCIVTWKLETDNQLTVTTECINQDDGLIPMQDGWHPYFSLGGSIDDLQLEFQATNVVEFDEELIPTKNLIPYDKFNSLKTIGATFLDNCFVLETGECQPLCVLRSKDKGVEVQFRPGHSYPFLQIYTPPGRKSIAIENLSGAPDGFNNGIGLTVLEPGESAIFTTAYKIAIL